MLTHFQYQYGLLGGLRWSPLTSWHKQQSKARTRKGFKGGHWAGSGPSVITWDHHHSDINADAICADAISFHISWIAGHIS